MILYDNNFIFLELFVVGFFFLFCLRSGGGGGGGGGGLCVCGADHVRQ